MGKNTAIEQNWIQAEKYLKYFGWFVIGSIATGLLVGHIPVLFYGKHWTTCTSGGSNTACLIIVHVWGVPIIGFSAFYAWYYFRKYSRAIGHQINLLLAMVNVVNIVYLGFQTGMVLDSIRRTNAAAWETDIMAMIAGFLVIGVGLGIYTNQKLTRALYPH